MWRAASLVLALALALASALGVAPARAAAQPALSTLPIGDPAYAQLDALDAQGCAAARVSVFRPYTVREVRAAVTAAGSDPRCQGGLLTTLRERFPPAPPPDTSTTLLPTDVPGGVVAVRPATADREDRLRVGAAVTVRATGLSNGEFRPLWRDIRPTSEGDQPLVGIGRVRASWGDSDRVALVTEAFGQTGIRNDPLIRESPLRTTSGVIGFSEAYLNVGFSRFVLSLGRVPEIWMGDGRESLVLSANGPSMDRIAIDGRWRRVEARALYGTLSAVTMTPELDTLPAGTPPQRFARFVAAHALTVRPGRSLELTLGETMVFARKSLSFDLLYANPLMPFVISQHDTAYSDMAGTDNLVIFGGARWRWGPATLEGQLAIDDIQIDPKDRKKTPDQLAWWTRATLPVPLVLPASVELSYRHINSYTYLRRMYASAYEQYGQPLGSELGPDADLLRGSGELWLRPALRLSGGVGLWRHGALRLDQRPGPDVNGHAGEPYPSASFSRPAVQRALLADAQLSWLGLTLPVTIRLEAAHVQHPNNQLAATASYLRAQFIGTYAFRYP